MSKATELRHIYYAHAQQFLIILHNVDDTREIVNNSPHMRSSGHNPAEAKVERLRSIITKVYRPLG